MNKRLKIIASMFDKKYIEMENSIAHWSVEYDVVFVEHHPDELRMLLEDSATSLPQLYVDDKCVTNLTKEDVEGLINNEPEE